jgi:hypothetical protein
MSEYTESGVSSILHNTAPVISGKDSDLGAKDSGFDVSYTVQDEQNEAITVTEAIDDIPIRTFTPVNGERNTCYIGNNTWLKLANGQHLLTITATDSVGLRSVRTYKFNRIVNSFTVENTAPYDSDTRPTRIIITVGRQIPPDSSFKVFVCNNGYDSLPTWEDATSAVVNGMVHVFNNSRRSADRWGVKIRVDVSRGVGEGACYITQIGGNFE